MTEALHLFEATGIELEYMIVDRESLAVRPVADELLRAACGRYESEIEVGDIAWSNELALHVIELKTNGPVRSLAGLAGRFQEHVRRIDALLAPLGAVLMPTGMHPFMDPHRELRLWPHEYSPVYEAFHRIFDCRGHGWANLQSMHVNLPFCGDEEFGPLHAAIRLVLPILPALAASTPIADGAATGWLDTRLEVYRGNTRRVPSVSGAVIPEPVYTRAEYEGVLLGRIYDDLAPLDPEGTLRHEWVNARGCIARFDRSALEIRLLDVQECPAADLAVAAAVIAVVRALVEERLSPHAAQRGLATERLAAILEKAIRDADATLVDDSDYLRALGFADGASRRAGAVWSALVDRTLRRGPDASGGREELLPALDVILREGCLARRIARRLEHGEDLLDLYRALCACLVEGAPLRSDA